jgi:hypothetical protein
VSAYACAAGNSTDPHLLDLAVHVKHMHLVASCEGMTLWLKAAQHIEEKIFLTDEEVKKCELLLIFAREKFEFALRSITGNGLHLHSMRVLRCL